MEESSTPTPAPSTPSATKVDCSGAAQSVWLMKVPIYMAGVWEKADSSGIVGSLRIPKQVPPRHMMFELAEPLLKVQVQGVDVPSKHRFSMADVSQTIGVFSETPADEEDRDENARGKIALEGKIMKRADCSPVEVKNYMEMKKKTIVKACRPVRQMKQMKELVQTFKPINNHVSVSEPEKKKKEDGKRVRADREDVLNTLYSAFEKHQYYTLKDLVGLTQQPVTHLKAILRDVCNYNLKNPHKNTYELKPEYRHYKKEEEKAEESVDEMDT